MKTTQSALREGVLFSTKRNNYYYDTGTGKVIVLDDDTSYIFRVLFDPTLSAETFSRFLSLSCYKEICNSCQ